MVSLRDVRIRECFGLEGTFRGSLVQPPQKLHLFTFVWFFHYEEWKDRNTKQTWFLSGIYVHKYFLGTVFSGTLLEYTCFFFFFNCTEHTASVFVLCCHWCQCLWQKRSHCHCWNGYAVSHSLCFVTSNFSLRIYCWYRGIWKPENAEGEFDFLTNYLSVLVYWANFTFLILSRVCYCSGRPIYGSK